MENAPGSREPEVSLEEETTEDESKSFEKILVLLKMEAYRTRKITLTDVLEICSQTVKKFDLQALEDVPWHFLRKLMALNLTARITRLRANDVCDEQGGSEDEDQEIEYKCIFNENPFQFSINPLDVLCVLLHCSDSFLQQEILLKMSMCQFALPLILPPWDGTKCTFMLWAMRDIVGKWRPHSLRDSKGFREESLVLTPMPTISFVRLGSCSLSKSKILNEVLTPPQQHHDFFIHRDMECGNVPRRISNGLVEIVWYFPGSRENSDLFPEPVVVTNLRGDIKSHWLQFSLLTQVSSAVFVFVDIINKEEYTLLSSLKESKAKVYFILNLPCTKETTAYCLKLMQELNLKKSHLLGKKKTMNDADFVNKLQSTIAKLEHPPRAVTLEAMASTARELGAQVDEDDDECQRAKEHAEHITAEISDVTSYKKKTMKLQGEPWKGLAKVEKELCRMKKQGDIATEDYLSMLKKELMELRRQQNDSTLTIGMQSFIRSMETLSKVETTFFLKWMKFHLACIARSNVSSLKVQYSCKTLASDPKKLAELDRCMYESSLGLEHFIREMGQFYEAECSMVKEGKVTEEKRKFMHLPRIAADLLLEGFPLELIDGDASNIPLQWVTAVLTELNIKLDGQCRIIVITVLGVQGTGKSTLLNTMFSLQFAVSSGRCTRGAFMLLIKVKENLRQDLGCDFILVIDTEGLKAPELATLEDSYEHDNELATLVIGLSDITIVNMAMENATEMKDILQIVVHAFLRMEKIGKKPICQFVHQNVSDVSAHGQNMRDRKHLLDHLNEMTKAAAKMEKQSEEITFADIIQYDSEKNNWYIPGLWHGVPPMAPVNLGYCEKVYELKRYLFELIRDRSPPYNPQGIPLFIRWMGNLWNAVKHEHFIFSFRNFLVVEAYIQLSTKYCEWEWEFCKEMHLWVLEAETHIQNQAPDVLYSTVLDNLKSEAFQKLKTGEKKLLNCLQTYFDSGAQHAHLIEKYREEFMGSAKCRRRYLESNSIKKCEEAIQIQKGKWKMQTIQAEYMKTIEAAVMTCLERCRKNNCELNEQKLTDEFETMWKMTLSELNKTSLSIQQIHPSMFNLLKTDLNSRGSLVNKRLTEVNTLLNCGKDDFNMNKSYIETSHWQTGKELQKVQPCAESIIRSCDTYIEQTVKSKVDYDETYCRQLLHMINERLSGEDFTKLHTNSLFEMNLKLHILGRASHAFQVMHEDFVRENDPCLLLETFKPQLLSTFKGVYQEKDDCQTKARNFCEKCLKPAMSDYVTRHLGIEIVGDIMSSGGSNEFSNQSFFQFSVLKHLLEENNFSNYLQYIDTYEIFVKRWILKYFKSRYRQTTRFQTMEESILSCITKKVRYTLKESKVESGSSLSSYLENVFALLQKDLVLSKDYLRVVLMENKAGVDEFSNDLDLFLSEVEQQILSEFKDTYFETKLAALPFKPEDVLFKKIFGCGKQCPFCGAPCEAGDTEHQMHYASIHRPQGLNRYRSESSKRLEYSICTSDVASKATFQNSDTKGKFHPVKEYRTYYKDWSIQPDVKPDTSDYWKFVFAQFNADFAKEYRAQPAKLPQDWNQIKKEAALRSISEAFQMK